MTFSEIVDLGIENGFIVNKKNGYNFLTIERKDGIRVELSFPDDNLLSILKEGENISWEYRLIDKNGMELFKDWLDIYRGTAKDKILDIKNQVLGFINKIATLEIRIEEKFVFSILGLKFLKYRVLQFRTDGGWTE